MPPPPRVEVDVDPHEFAALYDQHIDYVHRVALRLGIPASAVEDVAQEVFITAFKRHATFEGRASYRTWLYSITMFVVRRVRRDMRRGGLHGIIVEGGDEAANSTSAGPRSQPDVTFETQSRWKKLMRLLDGLEEPQREIFVLVELEQMQITEAADILEIPLNTAYSRIRLARAAFERALHQDSSERTER